MQIEVEKLTDFSLMKKVVNHVFNLDTRASLSKWYNSEHSPIRTQLFTIFAYDVPYSVCMQMRTHDKNGALFLIESGRPDNYGSDRVKCQSGNYREQPRNMFIMCNAQHLIDWSHKRLCGKAEKPTREFFSLLKRQITNVDADLAKMLVPKCVYRNGLCTEFKPCGER